MKVKIFGKSKKWNRRRLYKRMRRRFIPFRKYNQHCMDIAKHCYADEFAVLHGFRFIGADA